MSTFRITALLCALSLAGCGKSQEPETFPAEQIAEQHLAYVQAKLGFDPRTLAPPDIPAQLLASGPTATYWAEALAVHQRLKDSWSFDLATPMSTQQGLEGLATGIDLSRTGARCTAWTDECEVEADGTRCVRSTTCGRLTTTITVVHAGTQQSWETVMDGTAADGTVYRDYLYQSTQFSTVSAGLMSLSKVMSQGEQRPPDPGPWWVYESTLQVVEGAAASSLSSGAYFVRGDEFVQWVRSIIQRDPENNVVFQTWRPKQADDELFLWIVELWPSLGVCTRYEYDEDGTLVAEKVCW